MRTRRLKHRVNRLRLRALANRGTAGAGVFALDGTRRAVALSYDDGPSPENTPDLLELLERYGAKATFYAVGTNVLEHPELASAVVAAGHELGNHTWSHADPEMLTETELRAELDRGSETIVEATGKLPRTARPPWGNDRRRFAELAGAAGMQSVMWTVDSGDTAGFSAEAIARNVIADTRAGYIVLFHDGGPRRPATLTATEQVLRELVARKFEFVTVSSALAEPEA